MKVFRAMAPGLNLNGALWGAVGLYDSSKELSKELRVFRPMAPGLNLRGLGCRKGEVVLKCEKCEIIVKSLVRN